MRSAIVELQPTGDIAARAVYANHPKDALICFVKQHIKDDFRISDYPSDLEGIRQGHCNNCFYYEHGEVIFCSCPLEYPFDVPIRRKMLEGCRPKR
ncbi:MAG: hypothetical protein M0P69_13070 [Bacteroidales bacterium]|nr:hypothetical protein [Bacteroidales bacterium]